MVPIYYKGGNGGRRHLWYHLTCYFSQPLPRSFELWVPSSPTSPPSRPRCSTNDYVVCNAPACNLQRPGTPAGARGVYLSRWRRRPGLSYLLGRAGLTVASPYAAFRWPCEL
jgi:hypothetical protein